MSSLEGVKKMIRCVLLPAKEGVSAEKMGSEYKALAGGSIPYVKLGFQTLHDFILSIPDIVQIRNDYQGSTYHAVADESTMHIKAMVVKQKSNRKKKRRSVCSHTLHKVSHKSYVNPSYRGGGYKGLIITTSGVQRSVNMVATPKRRSGLLGDGPYLSNTQKVGQQPRKRISLLRNQPHPKKSGPIGKSFNKQGLVGCFGSLTTKPKSSGKKRAHIPAQKFKNPLLGGDGVGAKCFDDDQSGDWITESLTAMPSLEMKKRDNIPKLSSSNKPPTTSFKTFQGGDCITRSSKSCMPAAASLGSKKTSPEAAKPIKPKVKVEKSTKNRKITLKRNTKLSPAASKTPVSAFINPLMTKDEEKPKKMISTISTKQDKSLGLWDSQFVDNSAQENLTELEIDDKVRERIKRIVGTCPQGLATSQLCSVYQEAFKNPLPQQILFGLECGQIRNLVLVEKRTRGNREKFILHPITPGNDEGKLPKYKTPSDDKGKELVRIPEAVDMEPGSEHTAVISHVESCNILTVQLLESRNDLNKIQHVIRGAREEIKDVKVGMEVVTHFMEGRRAKVLRVSNETATVYHIDYGDIHQTSTNQLYRMPLDIAFIPKLAKHCSLHRPENIGATWPDSITSRFEEFCLNKEITIRVNSVIKSSGIERSTVHSVTCYVDQFNINFRLQREEQTGRKPMRLPGAETRASPREAVSLRTFSSQDVSNLEERMDTDNQPSRQSHPGEAKTTSWDDAGTSGRNSQQNMVGSRTGDHHWSRPKLDPDEKLISGRSSSSQENTKKQAEDIRDGISRMSLSRWSRQGYSGTPSGSGDVSQPIEIPSGAARPVVQNFGKVFDNWKSPMGFTECSQHSGSTNQLSFTSTSSARPMEPATSPRCDPFKYQPLKLVVPPNTCNVFLHSSSSTTSLHLTIIGDGFSDELEILHTKMKNHYTEMITKKSYRRNLPDPLPLRCIYAAETERGFERAKLIKIESQHCVVFLVDVGKELEVPTRSLHPIDEDFSFLPMQAFQVTLAGFEHEFYQKNEKILQILNSQAVKGRTYVCRVLYRNEDSSCHKYIVELLNAEKNMTLNRRLSEILSDQRLAPELLDEDEFQARIGSVDLEAKTICVRPSTDGLLALRMEEQAILTHSSNKFIPSDYATNLYPGKHCLHLSGGHLHRVVILDKMDDASSVSVRYIDYGKDVMVRRTSLLKMMTQRMLEIPSQAIKCICEDLEFSSLNPDVHATFRKIALKTVDSPRGTFTIPVINLCRKEFIRNKDDVKVVTPVKPGDSPLSSKRSKSCESIESLAPTKSSSTSSINWSQESDIEDSLTPPVFMKLPGSLKIPGSVTFKADLGRILPVRVTNVLSPGLFYMIPIVRIPVAETLARLLRSYYEENSNICCIPQENLHTGGLCAVQSMFNGTLAWQRACVVQAIPDFASVQLIDRGNVDCIPTSRIKPLSNVFASIPPLCLMGRLCGIKPKGANEWAASISKRFENRVIDMQFEAHIVRTWVHPDANKLVHEVSLCDMAMAEEWINDTMVDEWGVADYVL